MANIFAQITGSDVDFVVKVIDVYPAEVATKPEMGGYQLAISQDIFRGRYRDSFANPTAIPSGVTQSYKRSEEHTSELQSLMRISYAVFCLKKKNNNHQS